MQFVFSEKLAHYIQDTKKYAIIVEVTQSDGDFEITELHPHFISEKQAELFITRKKFHLIETDLCPVLLPNYRLDYQDTISLDLRQFGPIRWITMKGIQL